LIWNSVEGAYSHVEAGEWEPISDESPVDLEWQGNRDLMVEARGLPFDDDSFELGGVRFLVLAASIASYVESDTTGWQVVEPKIAILICDA